LLEEVNQCFFRCLFFALSGQHVLKFAFFNELDDDIKTSLELAIDVDLWERRPLCVKFEPLSDAFVSQNIKCLDVSIAFGLEGLDETACEFALWSVKCSLDKHHERVIAN
jgi:hypothetical protein